MTTSPFLTFCVVLAMLTHAIVKNGLYNVGQAASQVWKVLQLSLSAKLLA